MGTEEMIKGAEDQLAKDISEDVRAELKADIREIKETAERMKDSLPDSQITSLAAMTIKILLHIWQQIGKEESA
jgi:phosphoenolpyruvate synthase/pyruvate phosphate dikinase